MTNLAVHLVSFSHDCSEKIVHNTYFVALPGTLMQLCGPCWPESQLKKLFSSPIWCVVVCVLHIMCCFCRKCQANDWHSRHRTQCKMVPEALAEPFLLSIPASQATYSRLVQMLEAFSRFIILVWPEIITQWTNSLPWQLFGGTQ